MKQFPVDFQINGELTLSDFNTVFSPTDEKLEAGMNKTT
jgi:hypothetical protein